MKRTAHNKKTHERNNQISIESLLLLEMKEEFSGSVPDFIQRMKESLQKMHPIKARKIIFEIENNLKKFIQYPIPYR